jgi:undecaprenyl-diphosphatase
MARAGGSGAIRCTWSYHSMLQQLDVAILRLFNGYVDAWPAFDRAVSIVSEWSYVRATGLVCIVWWAWAAGRDPANRTKILAGLAGVAIATACSKLIQMSVFVHLRPFREAGELGLTLPRALATNWGYGSSFPSDTATMYFALAMVIFGVARKLGVGAFLWVAVVIALPRVYLTYHFPSDILAGFVLGAGVVWAMQRYTAQWPLWRYALNFEVRTPQYFYPVMFCYLYQVVDAFQFFDHTLAYLKPH